MRVMSINSGAQGTLETLRLMAALAREAGDDPNFSQYAQSFSTAAEINRVHIPVYRYADESIETLFTPQWNLSHLIQTGELMGDCDDISMFYAAMFHVLQIPSRLVAMRTRRNDPDFLHVVVEAYEDNRWKRFDPTVFPGLVQIDYGRMVEYV